MTDDELVACARGVLASQSRSYVTDAKILAEAVLVLLAMKDNHRLAMANLTAVQDRCNSLLEEARQARTAAAVQFAAASALAKELASLQAKVKPTDEG